MTSTRGKTEISAECIQTTCIHLLSEFEMSETTNKASQKSIIAIDRTSVFAACER